MKKLHPTAAQLLADIEAYRARVGIDRTTFGKEAAGDGHFITRVESGKLPRLDTIDRVYDYMRRKSSAVRKAARSVAPLLLFAVLLAPAFADGPVIPSEEQKKAALMEAYRQNSNSMVRSNMIDLTEAPNVVRTIPIVVAKPAPKIVDASEPPDLNMEDLRKFSRRANHKIDICARHGMHKVTTNHGKSWRCK